MLKYYNIAGTLLLLACMSLLGTSCQNRNQQVVNPWYSGHYHPKYVQFTLDNKKGKKVEMQIDHMRKRIYNTVPLPYGTKLDSAYLEVIMSNQLDAVLRNVSKETEKAFSSSDTGKINIEGGRLALIISRKDLPTLTYDIRIMSYGYDPDKLTWDERTSTAPTGVVEAKVVEHNSLHYYITRDAGGAGKLYQVDLASTSFVAQEANLPVGLLPKTLYNDHRGNAWLLDEQGQLFSSADLKTWENKTPEGVRLTQILNDQELNPDKPTSLSAIGTPQNEGDTYYIYSGAVGSMKQHEAIPNGFPVRDAFVYNYIISGTQHSNILGGIQANGQPTELSFFTSDGVHWGKTPYRYSSSSVPDTGGLFIQRREGQQIMLVGGLYSKEGISNNIKISEDRGITWKSLEKSQLPGKEFTPRINIAGTSVVDANNVEHIYLIGGVLSGDRSTQEVWHGYLDTTGGIINSFEN